MRATRIGSAITAAMLFLACGNGGQGSPALVKTPVSAAEPATATDFDPANFRDPAPVDNRWFPLQPGTRMVWEGRALDGTETIHRRVESTVTDLVKEIDGVQVVVVWELDFSEDVLEEAELAFFAADIYGSVWHFGEYPEEYDDGQIVKTPLWIAGVEGARPGIAMSANPQLDTPSYAQGWGPAVGWNDRGKTYRIDEHTCVPTDCYDDVVVTKEFSRTEPGSYQLKYYAPGVGNIRVGWGGPNEDEHEVLVLTHIAHLNADGLASVRAKVLAQEKRAYDRRPDVYGQTSPSHPRSLSYP